MNIYFLRVLIGFLFSYFAVPGKTHVLDTTNLLRSCVQSAVGMLRDQSEEASRSMKRIKILLSLLTEEGNLQGIYLGIYTPPLHPQKEGRLSCISCCSLRLESWC